MTGKWVAMPFISIGSRPWASSALLKYTWSSVSLSSSAISRQWDSARAYYIAREDDGQDERTRKRRMRLRPGQLGWVLYEYSRRWAATGEIIAACLRRCREVSLPGSGLSRLSVSALQPAPQLHHLHMRWSNRIGVIVVVVVGDWREQNRGVLLAWLCSRPLDMCRIMRTGGQKRHFDCTVHTVLYSENCAQGWERAFLSLPFPRVSLCLLSRVIVCPRLQYKIRNVFHRSPCSLRKKYRSVLHGNACGCMVRVLGWYLCCMRDLHSNTQ